MKRAHNPEGACRSRDTPPPQIIYVYLQSAIGTRLHRARYNRDTSKRIVTRSLFPRYGFQLKAMRIFPQVSDTAIPRAEKALVMVLRVGLYPRSILLT